VAKKARGETSLSDGEVRVVAPRSSRLLEPTLGNLDSLVVDSIVCGLCVDVRPLGGLLGMIDWRLCGRLSEFLKNDVIKGDDGEQVLMPSQGRLTAPRIFLYGWGVSTAASAKAAERIAAMAAMVEKAGAERVAFAFPEPARGLVDAGTRLVEEALGDRLVALFAADPLPPS